MSTLGGLLGSKTTSTTVTTAPGADEISFEELLRVIRRGNRATAEDVAREDEAEVDALLYERLEQAYAEQLQRKLTLSERSQTAYADSARRFVAFCRDVKEVQLRSCPALPGIVASWLHSELERGASGPVIRRHAAAISYMHRVNSAADPTDDPLIRAIVLKASTMKSTKKQTKAGKSRRKPKKGN